MRGRVVTAAAVVAVFPIAAALGVGSLRVAAPGRDRLLGSGLAFVLALAWWALALAAARPGRGSWPLAQTYLFAAGTVALALTGAVLGYLYVTGAAAAAAASTAVAACSLGSAAAALAGCGLALGLGRTLRRESD